MEIKGYSIWRPVILCQGNFDVMPSENALIIFLKEFPELADEFYSGNEFWIRTEEVYLRFLEELILERLKLVSQNDNRKNRYTQGQKKILKRGQRIVEFNFLDKQYEINTFGNKDNSVTMDLISFYDMLVNVKDSLGVKVIPETS